MRGMQIVEKIIFGHFESEKPLTSQVREVTTTI